MSSATLTMSAPHEAIMITRRPSSYSVRRYYDPATGQFISVDPAVDQTNAPYAYASGDPVDGSDPLGLWGWNPIDDAESAWNAVNPLSTSNVFYGIASRGGIGATLLGLNPFLPAAADFVGAANACSSGAMAEDIFAGIGWTALGIVDPEDEVEITAAEEGGGILSRIGAMLGDETGSAGKYGNLGNLASRADETVADVIRSRGGGASQIRELQTGFGELTLGEVSELAARGDRQAIKALKMVKQAGSQGKGGR